MFVQQRQNAVAPQRYVSLRTPQALRARLVAVARAEGRPLRMLCQEIINRFIDHAEAAARSGDARWPQFVATYKAPAGVLLGFWMDSQVAARVEALAQSGHVSRRALCYTAFLRAFPAEATTGDTHEPT